MKKFLAILGLFFACTTSMHAVASMSINAVEELQALPQYYPLDLAMENGDIISTSGGFAINEHKLDEFIANIKKDEKGQIRITSYSIEGDPHISILEYNGDLFEYTVDSSRDRWSKSDEIQRYSGNAVKKVHEKLASGREIVEYYLMEDKSIQIKVFNYLVPLNLINSN